MDDDENTRFVLRLILEHVGHEVVEAPHGEAALRLIKPDLLPDVITTDLKMPKLSGEEFIQRLRSEPRTASIPIVVVSGNHDEAGFLKAAGVVEAVVYKPFNAAAVAECIRAITHNASKPSVTV